MLDKWKCFKDQPGSSSKGVADWDPGLGSESKIIGCKAGVLWVLEPANEINGPEVDNGEALKFSCGLGI